MSALVATAGRRGTLVVEVWWRQGRSCGERGKRRKAVHRRRAHRRAFHAAGDAPELVAHDRAPRRERPRLGNGERRVAAAAAAAVRRGSLSLALRQRRLPLREPLLALRGSHALVSGRSGCSELARRNCCLPLGEATLALRCCGRGSGRRRNLWSRHSCCTLARSSGNFALCNERLATL
jgi:hypothetical protein